MKRLLLFATILICAVFSNIIAPHSPYDSDIKNRLTPPSRSHLFGTDEFGRDILSRVIYGTRISLMVGVVAVGIATVLGVFLGALAGYYGGKLDAVLMRLVDSMLSFPAILLAIAVSQLFLLLRLALRVGLLSSELVLFADANR